MSINIFKAPSIDRAFSIFPNNIIIKQLTYNKKEKLKSRKLIEHLFKKGKSINMFPVKMLYDFIDEDEFVLKAGITVSSRSFKKATDRNRIKRLLREAYRLQKIPLQNILKESGKKAIIFFIFTGKELPAFTEVHDNVGSLIQRLSDKIIKNTSSN